MKKLTTFPYHRALVLGLAKSGKAAAELLLDSQIETIVNDYKADENSPEVQELKQKGAKVVTGSHPLSLLDEADVVVKNPGIPYHNAIVDEAVKRGIPVITEVELAGFLHEGNLIGITGSNGKTTTTTLLHAFIEADQQPVSIAGNIGEVASEVARTTAEDETMVVELSSFQLMGIETFRPHIAVWLNLFEAHLDYHGTAQEYFSAKANIAKNQTSDDYLVYNADDNDITSFLSAFKCQLVPFSSKKQVDGSWADEEWIYFKDEKVMAKKDIVLVGEHNLSNILAALAAAKLSGVSNQAVYDVLTTFGGVEHRLEFVTKKDDIYFYNDSKATNILATSYALKAFDQPVVLLAGGLDRGNDFDGLIEYLSGVKSMVVFGETADKLTDAGEKAGVESIYQVETMDEAVRKARQSAVSGDVILLSPACASWDQYRTFEERGNKFKEAVHKL
ncbi:UDP-N-acetylmuramoyl-L-alanine--D-glutamate ligase [Halobacillus sp. Marseille-Q1614]|uniref:UDP-N-acetylmuramoyl-L-alanine--D-glutamate ligase n=1 Tax=Halobacillus sp. Marseille-Q1614 TaxID=2709134 RepID=UPI00156D8A73|nr:UDP-N-acetylmuramoyl-L-alanine--D-glutamate ligase [Halobacillus sp. Marseille-Q1614]